MRSAFDVEAAAEAKIAAELAARREKVAARARETVAERARRRGAGVVDYDTMYPPRRHRACDSYSSLLRTADILTRRVMLHPRYPPFSTRLAGACDIPDDDDAAPPAAPAAAGSAAAAAYQQSKSERGTLLGATAAASQQSRSERALTMTTGVSLRRDMATAAVAVEREAMEARALAGHVEVH